MLEYVPLVRPKCTHLVLQIPLLVGHPDGTAVELYDDLGLMQEPPLIDAVVVATQVRRVPATGKHLPVEQVLERYVRRENA
jgi:hypothetical protein